MIALPLFPHGISAGRSMNMKRTTDRAPLQNAQDHAGRPLDSPARMGRPGKRDRQVELEPNDARVDVGQLLGVLALVRTARTAAVPKSATTTAAPTAVTLVMNRMA